MNSVVQAHAPPDQKLWLDKVDIASVPNMKKALARIHVTAQKMDLLIPSMRAGQDSIKSVDYHRAKGRNGFLFSGRHINDGIVLEINRTDSGGSKVTRSALNMSEQFVNAAEILNQSSDLFKKSLATFDKTCEETLGQAKKRVSQLADYNVRLSVSLTNLNKSMGGESLYKALESAERMVAALEKLDELEKSGRLGKIMAAMQQ